MQRLIPKYPLYLELVFSDAYDRIENCKMVSIGDELSIPLRECIKTGQIEQRFRWY